MGKIVLGVATLILLIAGSFLLFKVVIKSHIKETPSKTGESSPNIGNTEKKKVAQDTDCPVYSEKCVTEMLKKEAKTISPKDLNYQNWITYENRTHNYKLKYPKDWQIDTSMADNFEDYMDSTCCNYSKLIISQGSTKWELSTDILYTGGQGWVKDKADLENCNPTKLDNYSSSIQIYKASTCGQKYEGPTLILDYPEIYKVSLFKKDSNKVLAVEYRSNDLPVIQSITAKGPLEYRVHPTMSLIYKGDGILENMDILDKITLSIKSL